VFLQFREEMVVTWGYVWAVGRVCDSIPSKFVDEIGCYTSNVRTSIVLMETHSLRQCRSCWHQGSSRRAPEPSLFDLSALFLPLSKSFRPKPMAVQNAVRHGCLYVRLWILCTICARVVCSYTFLHRLHTVGNECPPAQCFFAHKKRITERNLHRAGEASGSSISNGCQAKTEHRRQLAGVGTGRGGTKLHASVAGSRVTAFLVTAAP
jgi:hypothetical protein